jgi:hypothetical protein
MSVANSAAKKRRAPQLSNTPLQQQSNTPMQQQMQQQQQSQNGLTLPQVISLIDKRLLKLESTTNEDISNEDIDEIENKFEILAGEISALKEIVLNLQSYTMQVNKMLIEERNLVVKD